MIKKGVLALSYVMAASRKMLLLLQLLLKSK